MVFNRFSRSVILSIGLGWGLLSGVILSSSSYFNAWELSAHQAVVKLRKPSEIPDNILLVRLQLEAQPDPETFLYPDQALLADQFTAIINHLVPALLDSQGARMVVLKTPRQWPIVSDSGSIPPLTAGAEITKQSRLAETIETYHQRLVLVNVVSGQGAYPGINNFNSVLPFDSQTLEPKFAPQVIQGFWEDGNLETVQTAKLAGHFKVEPSGNLQSFPSMALLASQKLHRSFKQGEEGDRTLTQYPAWMFQPVWVPFLGQAGTFPRLHLKLPMDCQSRACYQGAIQKLGNLSGKVLLIDTVDTTVTTPLGVMSTQELQANVLASLLQGSFVKEALPLKPRTTLAIVCLVAIVLGGTLIWRVETHGWRLVRILWVGVPLFWAACALLYVLTCWQGVLLPIIGPVVTWTGTIIATSLAALIWQRELQFNQKVRELDALRGETEEEALVLKTQTLLRRIACDVHGGPLQELRVAMFQVENLQRSHSQIDVTPILDGLVHIGQNVREQLNNVQEIASKLRITPQLRAGLNAGMSQHLQQMSEVGRLQLEVIEELEPLIEPDLNTLWIAAREDIFRFFCEAMNNVVYHAQPPRGDATQVIVSLQQTGDVCRVGVQNNGSPLMLSDQWGQGTKVMAEIAKDLPEGQWNRTALTEGGLCVELCWLMQFDTVDAEIDGA